MIAIRQRKSLSVVLAIAAIAAFGVGGALAYSTSLSGHAQAEEATTSGGGTGLTPGNQFVNMNHGAIVSGHCATVSGFAAFMGPTLEPYTAAPPADAESWTAYE